MLLSPSYVYGVYFFPENAKVDKIENEVQGSKAQVETLWKKQQALLLHYRCTQLSASINVTSRLRPRPSADPTHQTEIHSVHRYPQHTDRQTDRRMTTTVQTPHLYMSYHKTMKL
jgi:hypothetical protein